MVQGLFLSYTPVILKHRRLTIVLVLIIVGLSALGIQELKVQVDPNADLPQDHPYVSTSNQIDNEFAGRNIVVVGISNAQASIIDSTGLPLLKRVTDSLSQLPGVVPQRIQSIWAPRTKDIASTDAGFSALTLLAHASPSDRNGDLLWQRILHNPIYLDTVIAQDRKTAFVLVDFQLEEAGGYRQILKNVKASVEKVHATDIKFYLGGLAVSLAWLEIYSERMQQWFLVVLGVVMLVSYLTFGTLQATFIPILTGLLSVVCTLGVMGWLRLPMDTYNVATPILIMTVAHGHSVQILKRFYDELEKSDSLNEAITRALVAIGPVMVTASAIAIASFLALLTFPLKTIQVFGAMAAIGIASALLLELTLIPALRSLIPSFPLPEKRIRRQKFNPLNVLAHCASRALTREYASRIFLMTIAITILLIIGANRIFIDNSLKGNFSPETEVRIDDTFINEHGGGTNTLYVLIEGKSADAIKDPNVLRGIEELQARLQQSYAAVGKTQSIADFLKKMNAAMHGDDPTFNRIPETRELAAQYLFLYSLSGDPADFDLYVDYDYRAAVLWVFLKTDSTAYAEQVIASITAWKREVLPNAVDVRFGGSVAETVALNEVMIKGKLFNLLIIGGSVFIFSSLVFRSLAGGALVLIPLAFTVITNFGIMGWLGIRLDIGTAAISALAVGVGADYAVYLLARIREELARSNWELALRRAVEEGGEAIISVALAVGSGYAVLLFSGFLAHMRLGGLVAIAMMVSCTTAMFVLPALIQIFRPRFLLSVAAPMHHE